ncbi:MAG TPA: MATE family efflux transporter [Ferruginibacter sp.]|nr:MATE family efflux transporter [Ferruginibacter sp.]
MTESINQEAKVSVFTLFKQAVRGDIKDFTTGSIDRAIFLLAVPMVLEMILEALFAIVDIYFVNKVSAAAVQTVGLTESSLTILYSVAWGLAMGATALIARRAGEKDFKSASAVAAQVILIAVAFSVLISIIGIIFPKEILHFMGASEAVVEENYRFTQMMLGSNVVIMLLFVNNGIFRGAGDASIAMKALILANIINIILDPLLIMGYGPFPKMGLMGAAYATTIGRSVGVIYQFYHLFRGKDLIKLSMDKFKANFTLIKNLLNTSSGAMFQFLIGSCSWIFLTKIVAESGTDKTAGYITAIRICIFTILPAWGIGNAAATLTGQNLGAGLPERAERSVWRSAFLALCFFAFVTVIFFFFGEQLMRFFTSNPTAIVEGTLCLHILAIGYMFFAYGMVLTQAFNGAGDSKTPTYINLFVFWGLQIPLAYFLAKFLKMGTLGVYMAIGIAESVLAIVSIIVFKKGRWKLVKV